VGEWIPVSERKPDCDRVLLSDGKNVTIATRYAPGAYDAWDAWEKMPTHWMPIPEPPPPSPPVSRPPETRNSLRR
jgi:hypothetical protein